MKLLIKGDVFRITLYALEFWWLEQQEGKKDNGQKTTTGQVTEQVIGQVKIEKIKQEILYV